jgi:predicted P-loop ATPase
MPIKDAYHETFRPAPKKKKKGKPVEATESNLTKALRGEEELLSGRLFRLDTFSGQTLLMQPIPQPDLKPPANWTPRDTTDVDVTRLIVWFQDNNFYKVSRGRVDAAIGEVADANSFSAAREELLALPAWDQTARLDRFWIDVCGVADAEDGMDDQEVFQRCRYLAATARCFFISIVARIMEPGCKVDTMPVLEGPQGALKSSLLKVVALRKEWLSDSMTHDVASKDAKAHLAGKLIVEMAEMQQMKASGVEAMKKFLTVESDKFRPSYGRREIVQPRQCVFVGTTNSSDYFRDATGNRRFWPIPCGNIDLRLAERIMPQLYAEALVAYRAKEAWWLPKDVEILAEIEQDKRLTEDPWADGVATVVDRARNEAIRNGETFFWITSVQALETVEAKKENWDYQKQYRVALILRKLGGKNMRLPRSKHEQKRGFRFIIGANGAEHPVSPVSPVSAKSLN